jgi:hypothetical protein
MFFIWGSAFSQDTLEQRSEIIPVGGKWSSSGSITTFTTIGQSGVETLLTADTLGWSGSVGFVPPVFRLRKNNAPVAVASSLELFINVNDPLILEGFDPDGDPIAIEIIQGPGKGEIELVPNTFGEFNFTVAAGLSPETIYRDSIVFKVVEVNSNLESEIAVHRFKFKLEDAEHTISDMSLTNVDASNAELMISWQDAVFNKNYSIKVDYYDLTNPVSPVFKSIVQASNPLATYSAEGDVLSYSMGINSTDHPYIFSASKVFVTVLVTTPNGNSDFNTFIIDNTAGGRVEASEDGLFFAFGSEMSVAENGSVKLSLVGVELGDFNLANSTIEIIEQGTQGNITVPVVKSTTANTKTWNVTYTSTQQIGGNDEIAFRIYNVERQLFDTAYATIDIIDVNDPPKLTRIADQLTDEEVAIQVPLAYDDPDNEVTILVESNENSKVPVTYANGIIEINPSKDFSGKVSINVVISEVGTEEEFVAFDRFDVEITPVNDAPVVSRINAQSFDEDNVITLVLSATDVDAELPVFDFTATSDKPSLLALTIDGNNLIISPKPNVNGEFSINVYADDRLGTPTSKSNAETFSMVINAVNDAPYVVKNFKTQRVVPGSASYEIDLSAYFSDVENGSNLTYSAVGNVKVGLTFNGNKVSVIAPSDFSEFEDITFTANDGELEVNQQVTFVEVVQDPSIVVANPIGALVLAEDFGTYTVDASNVFVDQNNAQAVFEYDLVGSNFIITSIDENGIITFQSLDEFFGNESLLLIGSTGNQSNYVSFTLEVTPVNDAPEVQLVESQLMQEDVTKSNIFVEISDIDNEFNELIFSVSSSNEEIVATSDITFSATTDGYLVSIKPLENKFGELTLTVMVSDGTDESTTTFNVNVQSVNDQPVLLVTSLASTNEDAVFSLDIATLFNDVDGDALTYTVSQKPEWSSVSDNIISGTPLNSDVGTANITVKADDGNGGTLTASYQLEVLNENDAPTLVNAVGDITVFQENSWSFNFPKTSFDDEDAGDVLSYSFENFPAWASVSGDIVSGTPKYEDIGEYSLIMKVTDVAGASVTHEVKVNVIFTVYDAEVILTVPDQCQGGRYTVTASGAVSYNWYDADDELIFEDVSSVELTEAGTYYVEGVDSEGRATPEKESFDLSICLAIDDLKPVSIYPNPASEFIQISKSVEFTSLLLTDITGKVFSIDPQESGEMYRIQIGHLSEGLYFLKYQINGEPKTAKLIKKNQ